MSRHEAQPPITMVRRITRRILERVLPSSDREFILGDLEELHQNWVARKGVRVADWWYVKALFASVASRFTSPRGRTMEPHLTARRPAGADFLIELGQATRMLGRNLGLVAAVAMTLGIGVGAAATVFGMINQLLLRPLAGVTDPAGAAYLEFSTPDRSQVGISGPLAQQLRDATTLLSGFATFDFVRVHASAEDTRPVDVRAYTIHGDYFELLGVRPTAGRLLAASETGPRADPFKAVISERLWEQLFARSPDAIGRQFQANGHTVTVLGVAAGDFRGTDRTWEIDLWIPRSAYALLTGYPQERLWSPTSNLNQYFVIRPRAGATFDAAEAEINAVLRRLAESAPAEREQIAALSARVHPGLNVDISLRGRIDPALHILGLAGILILLIPCANVANLLLVRALNSRGEIAVRRALGASGVRIARIAMIESFLLAIVGTLTGLGAAWLIGLTIQGEALWGLPGFEGFMIDWRVIAFASAAVLVTTLLSGTLPSVLAARFDPGGALRDAGSQVTHRHGWLRHGMSAVQIALSLTLLVGSLLLSRTVRNAYAIDMGMDIDNVYVASIDLGREPLDDATLVALHRRLMTNVSEISVIESTALQSFYGPHEGSLQSGITTSPDSEQRPEWRTTLWVTPGWFELFRIRPLEGRVFTPADAQSSGSLPVILSKKLATRLFQQTNVVGRKVWVGTRDLDEAHVIGVVDDLQLVDLRSPPEEAFFLPYPPQQTSPITVLARSSDAGAATGLRIQEAIAAAAPAYPVPVIELLRTRTDAQFAEQRILASLLGIFSGLAVLLASVGLYGVVAFSVAGRRREFAIRSALGADGARIARLVLVSAATILLVGTVLGLIGAIGLSRVLESRLYGVDALDPASYVGAAGMLAMVAALACWLPARAAVTMTPVATLKDY